MQQAQELLGSGDDLSEVQRTSRPVVFHKYSIAAHDIACQPMYEQGIAVTTSSEEKLNDAALVAYHS